MFNKINSVASRLIEALPKHIIKDLTPEGRSEFAKLAKLQKEAPVYTGGHKYTSGAVVCWRQADEVYPVTEVINGAKFLIPAKGLNANGTIKKAIAKIISKGSAMDTKEALSLYNKYGVCSTMA